MADPVTMAIVAGVALQAGGKVQEGQIAAAQGDLDKEIAIRNQQSLERQATAERAASKIEEGRVARKSRLVQARLEAGQAKSGLGLAGATVDALADAAFQFSFDRNLVLRQGLIRSRELQQKGKIIAAGGRFAKTLGRQKRTALFMSAAGSALSAASSFGGGTNPRTSPSGPSSVGDLNTGTTTSSGRRFA
jgi:hypothetical protein